jgi:hypothetical protein
MRTKTDPLYHSCHVKESIVYFYGLGKSNSAKTGDKNRMALLNDKLDIGQSFLEGNSYTIGLTTGTGPDTPYNDRVSVNLDEFRDTIVCLEHPVHIMQDFYNLLFNRCHMIIRVKATALSWLC